MRLIFLDFDGVINTMGTYGRFHAAGEVLSNRLPVEPSCMEILNRIIERTGAKVVVSSSWRNFARGDRTMLQGLLAREGFRGEVVGVTPPSFRLKELVRWGERDRNWSQRGDEIKKWLDEQPEKHEFVVLDDDSDMDVVKDRFVQTDCREGLQEKHLEQVLRLFT